MSKLKEVIAFTNKLNICEWLFLTYIFTISFVSFLPGQTYRGSFQLSDGIFLILASVWGIRILLQKEKLRWSWLFPFLAAYSIALILSTITSVDPSQSFFKLVGKFYLIGIIVLTHNLVRNLEFFKKVVRVWLFGCGITLFFSFAGIILFYLGLKDPSQNIVLHNTYGSLPPGNYPRLEGFFNFPAMFSNFLSVSWMFLIILRSNDWIKRSRFSLVTAVLWIVNFFTITPGIGGIFLSTGLFLKRALYNRKEVFLSRLILAAAFSIAVGFLFVASFTLFAFSSDGSRIPMENGEFSLSHRANAWRTTFETFLENPIFGKGIDMPIANSVYTNPSGGVETLTDAHNTYASVLGETGLVGFLTFFAIIGFTIFRLLSKDEEILVLKTVKFCLLLALIDAFLYQSVTASLEDMRHLWILLGLSVSISEMENEIVDSNSHLS